MIGWAEFVDLIHAGLVVVSTALGGSMGWAIAVVSLAVRVALLPLTLRMAYRALETQAALKRLEPQLTRIRARYGKDQRRVLEETARLYDAHGLKMADPRSLLGSIVQFPIVLGLFGAIRRGLGEGGAFLWIKSIAAPDVAMAAIGAAITALTASLAPQLPASQRVPAVVLPALVTLLVLSRLAAGLSIYTVAQGLVGVGQAVLVRRRARQILPA
jgi:YidC/Oxa1 family membrane protein insertase